MHLRPWIRSDIPVVATILAECNDKDTLSLYLNPYRDKYYTSYRKGGLDWIRGAWLKPGLRAFVLTGSPEELSDGESKPEPDAGNATQSEVIVGWAWFRRTGTSSTAQNWLKPMPGLALSLERTLLKVEEFVTNYLPNQNPSRNSKNWATFLAHPNTEFDEEIFAEYWEVDVLNVDPKYQRRGHGKILLDWVFDRAREEQVPVCVKGSPRGGPMYRKYGFKSIGEMGFNQYFDELAYGGEPVQMWVWEPEGSDGKWWERAKQKREEQRQKEVGDERAIK